MFWRWVIKPDDDSFVKIRFCMFCFWELFDILKNIKGNRKQTPQEQENLPCLLKEQARANDAPPSLGQESSAIAAEPCGG